MRKPAKAKSSTGVKPRRRPHGALAQAAARFKAFADISSDWWWETDSRHRFNFVSDKISRWIDPKRLIGLDALTCIVSEPAGGEPLREVMKRGDPFQERLLEFRAPDGQVVWIAASATPRHDAKGRFKGYLGTSRDMTDVVAAQEALRKSDVLHRSIADSVDGIVTRVRVGGEVWPIEYLSPRNEEMFGIPPARMVGLDVRDVWRFGIHRGDLERYSATVEAAVAKRLPFEVEYRVREPSGGYRWVLERGRVVADEADGGDRLHSLMVDITRQVATRRALEESEQRFDSLSRQVDAILYRAQAHEPFQDLYYSPSVERLIGYTVEELTRPNEMMFSEIIHPDDAARVKRAFESVQHGTEVFECEYRIRTKSGETRWIYDRGAAANFDRNGKPRFIDGIMLDITARKATEAKLERLARNLDGTIYRGRVSPPELISFFGRRPPPFEAMHKGDLGRYVHEVADACRAMRPFEIEFRVIDENGGERWMLERGTPTEPDANGIAQFVDCLVIDITAHRRLREELEAREKLISALANNLEGAMFRLRIGKTVAIEYISPGIKKIAGLDAEEIIGASPEALGVRDPADSAEHIKTVTNALKARQPYESQYRLKHADGSFRWIIERGMGSAYDEHGRAVVVDGFLFDVTERHRLTEELRERERQFATLAGNIDGVMFRARIGRPVIIDYYSPGIEKQVGIPAHDLIGKPSIGIQLMHPDDTEPYHATIRAALANRQPYEVEFRMVLPTGRTIWVLERGSATEFDAAGEPTIVEGFSIEISARKEAEAASAAARNAAEAANRAKSEFLAMMTHEIRTPMNGVLGMTSVLLDSGLSAAQQRHALAIRESAEGLLRIINDVLDFSKLEAGAMAIEAWPFDLYALVRHAEDIFAPKASARGVGFEVHIAAAVPRFVRADAGRIKQVLLNLVGNAVKFTESGFVAVRVDARQASGRHILSVSVADTGIGIAADRIGRLFQSFEQADASISRRFGGTGLGLAISRKLVERMGGTIGVDSESGHGSTFRFEIPIELAEGDAPAPRTIDAAAVAEAVEALKDLGRRPRVLVVEDNATNRLVATSFLDHYGLAHDVAIDGRAAVEAVQHAAYDVVLMDLHMPEMDGLEAARAIRALPGTASRVPIVALTANAFADDVARCRAAGMNAHLGKPFHKEELVIAIASVLRGLEPFRAATSAPAESPAFDVAAIERFRADSGEEMLRLLIDGYLAETAEKLVRLATLVREGTTGPEACRLAHTLKSTSALAGAAALSARCAQIESQLAAGGAVAAGDVDALDTLFERYQAELKESGLAA